MVTKAEIAFPLLCDCCGKEKLAEVKDGKLIIFDTRHGRRHFVVVEIEKLQHLTEDVYYKGKEERVIA